MAMILLPSDAERIQERAVKLFLIKRGKPHQNGYIASFSGHFQ